MGKKKKIDLTEERVLIRIENITDVLLKIVEEAREKLVLVSAYVQIEQSKLKKWTDLLKRIDKAIARGVKITIIGRSKDYYHKKNVITTLKEYQAKGCDVYLVPKLHAKFYYNEKTALITSMNLYKGSTIANLEIASLLNQPRHLEVLDLYVEELKELFEKKAIDSKKRIISKVKAPTGLKNTYFKVTSKGTKYYHLRLEGKYPSLMEIIEVKKKLIAGKTYECVANINWRTMPNKRKKVYLSNVTKLKEK